MRWGGGGEEKEEERMERDKARWEGGEKERMNTGVGRKCLYTRSMSDCWFVYFLQSTNCAEANDLLCVDMFSLVKHSGVVCPWYCLVVD